MIAFLNSLAAFLKNLFRNDLGAIRYAGWEWIIMRVAFAPVIWMATWQTFRPELIAIPPIDPQDPNGLAGVFDLSWMSGNAAVAQVSAIAFLALLLLYVSGFLPLLATGGLALLHAVIGGIYSGGEGDHHATQVVGLILLGQFGYFLYRHVRGWITKEKPLRPTAERVAPGVIFISMQMMAAGYVVSGISKWIGSGGGLIPGAKWISQIPNIVVQFEKNQGQRFYDLLQEPASEGNAWAINFVAKNPELAMAFFSVGFFLELFAFVGLFNRRLALLFGVALISMHAFIAVFQRLNFIYFQLILLIFFVNLPFWIVHLAGRKRLDDPGMLAAKPIA